MSIDFKDVITFKGKDGGRVGIPRAAILSIKTKMERDYSANADKEITMLFVAVEVAEKLGFDIDRLERKAIGVFIPIGEKYEIALAIMQGKQAAEILF